MAAQVHDYQRALSPEPRRRVKIAILGLAEGLGDVKPLHGSLEGLGRLRVGEHRMVYRQWCPIISR